MAQTRIAPPAARAEGQWAFDQKEPLNGNELFKQQDDALNVRQRIEDVYSREGFASIAPEDLRGRMRWWGLYTQRKPGIDGGKTATLEPHELDDEYFMLRVRCDGGALSLQQLRTVADISVEFGRGTADVTDRQNIQLHWIRVEDVPEIWRRLEAVGLSTQEACGDCPRVVLGSPVAGRRGRRDHRRHPGRARDRRQLHRRPAVLEPPPQVQDRDQRLAAPRRRARDQRRRVRRRGAPHARPGLRRVGGRRAVHQPEARRPPRRVRHARADPRRVGRRREHLPRLRLPPAAHACAPEVPRRRLGTRAVPAGAGGRVPRLRAGGRPRASPAAHRPSRPRRRAPAERRAASTSAWRPRSVASPASCCSSWPTSSRPPGPTRSG